MSDSKTALVTGAASGIGFALSSLLAERDYRLHLFDVDREALAIADAQLQGESVVAGDVADPAAWQELANAVGAVDLLCLNAGVISTVTGAPWEASPREWERVLGVNLLGVVNGLRSFVPLMVDRGDPAHILITASLAGAATWPGGGPYAASKHAVMAVAEQAALALDDTHVRVTVLCPALVISGMSDQGDDPRDTATEALAAVADGRFAVLPIEWEDAIQKRATDLVSGARPTPPEPTP